MKLISIEHCFPHTVQTQAQYTRRRLLDFGIEWLVGTWAHLSRRRCATIYWFLNWCKLRWNAHEPNPSQQWLTFHRWNTSCIVSILASHAFIWCADSLYVSLDRDSNDFRLENRLVLDHRTNGLARVVATKRRCGQASRPHQSVICLLTQICRAHVGQ